MLAQTPMSLFAVPMDARTCHFHRTVGYLENGCRKNPSFKSNDDDDDDVDVDDDDDGDDETLRRGCCDKRRTRHVTRVHLGVGHGTGHSEQSGDIWIRKESTPRCPWLLIT